MSLKCLNTAVGWRVTYWTLLLTEAKNGMEGLAEKARMVLLVIHRTAGNGLNTGEDIKISLHTA